MATATESLLVQVEEQLLRLPDDATAEEHPDMQMADS